MTNGTRTGFADVDVDPKAHELISYLDTVSMLAVARAYKQRSMDALGLRPGASVIDVGCGTGTDAVEIAARVGERGRVVGVDTSELMVKEARARTISSSLPVDFLVGDAHRLAVPDATFDASRADRVFQHLRDPTTAFAEMVRVIRPGASVVVADPDWATLLIDVPPRRTTTVVVEAAGARVKNPWMGRELARLFHQAGLQAISVTPITAVITEYEVASAVFELNPTLESAQRASRLPAAGARAWRAAGEAASMAGEFFSSLTGFVVSGRKPLPTTSLT